MSNLPPGDRPPMPPQPTTKELPAADKASLQFSELRVLLIGGFKKTEDQIASLDKKVDRLEANQDLQAGQLSIVQVDVRSLYEWKGAVEQRMSNSSMRAKAPSQIDMDLKAGLDSTVAKQSQIEAVLTELQKQSAFMGIGKRGVEWLRSKEARADVIRVVTLGLVAYATLRQAGVFK